MVACVRKMIVYLLRIITSDVNFPSSFSLTQQVSLAQELVRRPQPLLVRNPSQRVAHSLQQQEQQQEDCLPVQPARPLVPLDSCFLVDSSTCFYYNSWTSTSV